MESSQHYRHSIRLKGYDYSQCGLYFITICTQRRADLFGNIHNEVMILNDAGRMIENWYNEIEQKFPDIQCHEMIIMPNHMHFIIENTGLSVGADLRVCPEYELPIQSGEHTGSPLHVVIQWFKTMTTNAYIRGVKELEWKPFDGKLWQRNYYEHIIRNQQAYIQIANYIINNPANWKYDRYKKI